MRSGFAGWFNITFGRIFQVGDRIKMGGVHGDVIDVTLLRTKLMEIGSASDETCWVKGRQFTGRIVTVSNKATFTEPVFNSSSICDYVWEEFDITVPTTQDWEQARQILATEVAKVASGKEAQAALRQARCRLPIPAAEVTPQVFISADENALRLSARFLVPLRTARPVKDSLSRAVLRRLAEARIDLAPVAAVEVRATGDDDPERK